MLTRRRTSVPKFPVMFLIGNFFAVMMLGPSPFAGARASTGHQIIANPRQSSSITTVAETKKAQRIDTSVNPRIYS